MNHTYRKGTTSVVPNVITPAIGFSLRGRIHRVPHPSLLSVRNSTFVFVGRGFRREITNKPTQGLSPSFLRRSAQSENVLRLTTLLQILLEKLHRLFQVRYILGFMFYLAGIHVRDRLQTQIRYPPNSVRSQDRKQLAAVRSFRLALSQMLQRLRNRPDVLDRAAIFPHQVNVDVLRLQRRFETLQFENCLIHLQIDAPKTLVWNRQLDHDTVRNSLPRLGRRKHSRFRRLRREKIRQRNSAPQIRIIRHLHKTAVRVDLPRDSFLFHRDAILAAPAHLDRNDHREAPCLPSLRTRTIGCHRTLLDRHWGFPFARGLEEFDGFPGVHQSRCTRKTRLSPGVARRYCSKGQCFPLRALYRDNS